MGILRRYRSTSGHAEHLPDKGSKTPQRKDRDKSLHRPRTHHHNHTCEKYITIENGANLSIRIRITECRKIFFPKNPYVFSYVLKVDIRL